MKSTLLAGIIALMVSVSLLSLLRRSADPTANPSTVRADPSITAATSSSVAGPESALKNDGDAPARGRDLISARLDADVVWNSKTPAAHRVRAIEPDAALLARDPVFRIGDRLTLPLFDDAVLDAVLSDVTTYPNGAVGMTARLQGAFNGTVYLSSCGGELRIHAEVLGGNDFYVRYDAEQCTHIAIEMDRESSDFQEDCMTCSGERGARFAPQAKGAAPENGVEVMPPPAASFDGTNDSVVVDVMIVYTPAALAAEGSVNAINNNIALAMQKANAVHGNSDTKVTLNLVYSGETAYTESGDPLRDLEVLTFKGSTNSLMDDVHALRDTYSVDMVCLLEDNPGTGGVGWLLNNVAGRTDMAFCLVRVQQSDTGYTVVHEWGHNMGCDHSSTQSAQPGPGLFSYSSGWQWNDSASSHDGYCTVMTYENFDGMGGNDYERVPHFSNPTIAYTGAGTNATGDAVVADNARSIRNVRFAVADYRIPAVPVTTYPCSNSFENAYSPWRYYNGSAGWEREDGSDANIVNNAPNIATTTAADGDHFVMVDGLNAVGGETAILEAVFDFHNLTSPTIEFSYCMYSAWGVEVVNTLQVSTNNGSSWSSLWTNAGESDNAWYQESIDLSAYAGLANVQIRFKADTGTTWYKNYACLDGIVVSGAVASSDIDGDGLPNEWETLYFGGPTNAVAEANPDGDFYTNIEEYIAGLNPTNADSIGPFYLMSSGSNQWFSWTPVPDRLYSVYWTSNLLSGFSLLESNLTTGSYTDTVHAAEPQGFYRLGVELAP